jgi:coiled-coil domain-containing protein 12
MSEETVGHLQEEALKRKQRLEAMRKQTREAAAGGGGGDAPHGQEALKSLPKPIFRSYHPQDESLKELKLPKIQPESVEEQVKEDLAAGKPEPLVKEIELTNLAPRKVDWDLKRNITKKLNRLEKRTQRSIAELIRERIKSSEGISSKDHQQGEKRKEREEEENEG